MTAMLAKNEVPLPAALDRAAEILAGARMPLFTGTGSDVAGMRAALRLVARTGGVADFCRGPNLTATMADTGMMFTTPREARSRADVMLLVGPETGRSEMIRQTLAGQPLLSAGEGTAREVLWLCPGSAANSLGGDEVAKLGGDVAALPGILAVLNACAAGRAIPADGFGGFSRAAYEDIAGRMMTARFGVIAFSPADLDPLAVEALMTLARTLNKNTRVTTLPVSGPAGQQTAALVSTWTTGFPPRVGFGRGFPEYDPWRFDATRMIASGECDALVWLSSFEAAAPGWRLNVPLIAITAPGAVFSARPEVYVETGVPGGDFNAEVYSETLQTLVHTEATRASDAAVEAAPTPAAVLEGILTRLEARAT